ncbi:MAG: zf-HC2 domain-containing protein [Actinomycetota bacterium]
MSSPLAHERCSELLSDYVSGGLDSELRARVEDHLAHCAQCAAERDAVVALGAEPADGPGLTEDERVVLRARVLGAAPGFESPTRALGDESDAVVVPLEPRRARAGTYLGIAAMLAILAVGFAFVSSGGGFMGADSESGDAAGGGGSESDLQAEDDEGAGAQDSAEGVEERAPLPSDKDLFRLASELRPVFDPDRGAISEDGLDLLARRPAFRRFSETSSALAAVPESQDTAARAEKAEDRLLRTLAAGAPRALSGDVAACGRTALAELDGPGLATYATTARLDGREAIIIGLVTGRSLNRYVLVAFPAADCSTILTSTEGPLDVTSD